MNFDLNAMQFELDSLASSRCLSGPDNLAAKRASELLRAVRSALDLPWETQAADLHGIGQNVEPNEYLKKVPEESTQNRSIRMTTIPASGPTEVLIAQLEGDGPKVHLLPYILEELKRLHQVERAWDTWQEKTWWVQATVEPVELGMHRADVLRQRIDRVREANGNLYTALDRIVHRLEGLPQFEDDNSTVAMCVRIARDAMNLKI